MRVFPPKACLSWGLSWFLEAVADHQNQAVIQGLLQLFQLPQTQHTSLQAPKFCPVLCWGLKWDDLEGPFQAKPSSHPGIYLLLWWIALGWRGSLNAQKKKKRNFVYWTIGLLHKHWLNWNFYLPRGWGSIYEPVGVGTEINLWVYLLMSLVQQHQIISLTI